MEPREITQADREAAAAMMGFHARQTGIDELVRAGSRDDEPLVQAFAAHREVERARIVAWLREDNPLRMECWCDEWQDISGQLACAIECNEL